MTLSMVGGVVTIRRRCLIEVVESGYANERG